MLEWFIEALLGICRFRRNCVLYHSHRDSCKNKGWRYCPKYVELTDRKRKPQSSKQTLIFVIAWTAFWLSLILLNPRSPNPMPNPMPTLI